MPGLMAPSAQQTRVHPAYGLIYTFKGKPDGGLPLTGLLVDNGNVYGTTSSGGSSDNGTIFAISIASKKEVMRQSFSGSTDGAAPEAGVIHFHGNLYGTTSGAKSSKGTVFVLSSGQPKTFHLFKGGKGGATPTAELDNPNNNGTFYGTTQSGGGKDQGTIFAITTAGAYRVMHSFAGKPNDGANPQASLTGCGCAHNDMLYGTTEYGGTYNKGTVFTITLSGTESVVYSFKGGSDGALPRAGIFYKDGTLYGTTADGGTHNAGTVFAISSSSGAERVIYTFKGRDGRYPIGGLTQVSGAFYGTTSAGGANGTGTIFKLALGSGTEYQETLLYSFGKVGSGDGASPQRRLVDIDGTLYGTTVSGGKGSCIGNGCGTLFSLSP